MGAKDFIRLSDDLVKYFHEKCIFYRDQVGSSVRNVTAGQNRKSTNDFKFQGKLNE